MNAIKESILSIAELCCMEYISESRAYLKESLLECRKPDGESVHAEVMREFADEKRENAFGSYIALHVLAHSMHRESLLDESELSEVETYLGSCLQAHDQLRYRWSLDQAIRIKRAKER